MVLAQAERYGHVTTKRRVTSRDQNRNHRRFLLGLQERERSVRFLGCGKLVED